MVLTGAGGNFCAGADISEFATVRADSKMGDGLRGRSQRGATRAVRDCELATIAAVSGYAMGGGCGLALACDLRVGDGTTRMGIPAARLGIVYGPLDSSLLLRQVGLGKRQARALLGARLRACQDCRRMGLVDMTAEQGGALEAAHALAADLAENAPLSLARRQARAGRAARRGTADARAGEISTPSSTAPWTAPTTAKARAPSREAQAALLGR